MDSLPQELVLLVASELKYSDILEFGCTASTYTFICHDRVFWRKKAKRDFNIEEWEFNRSVDGDPRSSLFDPIPPREAYLKFATSAGEVYIGSERYRSRFELAERAGKINDLKLYNYFYKEIPLDITIEGFAEGGYKDSIDIIINTNFFEYKLIKNLICGAAKGNHADLIEYLLNLQNERYCKLLDEVRSAANEPSLFSTLLSYLNIENDMTENKYLKDEYKRCIIDSLKYAMRGALEGGHLNLFKCYEKKLLKYLEKYDKDDYFGDESKEDQIERVIALSTRKIARGGHIEIIRYQKKKLGNKKFLNYLVEILPEISSGGHLDTLNELCALMTNIDLADNESPLTNQELMRWNEIITTSIPVSIANAAAHNHLEVVKYWLKMAQVHALDDEEYFKYVINRAVYYAVKFGHLKIILYLYDNHEKFLNEPGKYILCEAISSGDPDILQFFIDKGQLCEDDLCSYIEEAASLNNDKLAVYLLSLDKNKSIPKDQLEMMLLYSAKRGLMKSVQALDELVHITSNEIYRVISQFVGDEMAPCLLSLREAELLSIGLLKELFLGAAERSLPESVKAINENILYKNTESFNPKALNVEALNVWMEREVVSNYEHQFYSYCNEESDYFSMIARSIESAIQNSTDEENTLEVVTYLLDRFKEVAYREDNGPIIPMKPEKIRRILEKWTQDKIAQSLTGDDSAKIVFLLQQRGIL